MPGSHPSGPTRQWRQPRQLTIEVNDAASRGSVIPSPELVEVLLFSGSGHGVTCQAPSDACDAARRATH